jgi:hypothetical protein
LEIGGCRVARHVLGVGCFSVALGLDLACARLLVVPPVFENVHFYKNILSIPELKPPNQLQTTTTTTTTTTVDFLICVEMLLASLAHFYIFPHAQVTKGRPKTLCWWSHFYPYSSSRLPSLSASLFSNARV